jgi:lipopolysaccharide export system protein LptC
VPLPIGHEAKGLVLPDYDEEGRLQARFEAATAKRVNDESIEFTGLKMTTYVVETNTPDLLIDLPAAALNITTRVVSSDQRTTITRADFSIAGDTMRFDTVAREGRLMGNVKMVINDSAELSKALGE